MSVVVWEKFPEASALCRFVLVVWWSCGSLAWEPGAKGDQVVFTFTPRLFSKPPRARGTSGVPLGMTQRWQNSGRR